MSTLTSGFSHSHSGNRNILGLSTRSKLAVLFLATIASSTAHAQLSFNPGTKLNNPGSNVANQGSPALVNAPGGLYMYYVNHNSPYTVYLNVGLSQTDIIATNINTSNTILSDVGAAVVSSTNQILLSYINTNNQVAFALSTGGTNFTPLTTQPSNQSLGLPAGDTPDPGFTPAMVSNNGTIYVITVAQQNEEMYLSTTTNGQTFTAVTPGVSPDGWAVVSRPSLTVFNGTVWVGALTVAGGVRMGLVGNVLSPSSFNFVSSVAWSQSNRQISSGEKYWAGISIVGYGGVFYVFGQSTNSNQNLLYTYTSTPSTPSSWAPQQEVTNNPNLAERWTPFAIVSGALYVAYQDNGDTQISFTYN